MVEKDKELDSKLSQEEFVKMVRPFELDLLAVFSEWQDRVIELWNETLENEQTVDEFLQKVSLEFE